MNTKYENNIPLSGSNNNYNTISTINSYYTTVHKTLPDIKISSQDNNINDSSFNSSPTTSTINQKIYNSITNRRKRKMKNNIIISQMFSLYHLILAILVVYIIQTVSKQTMNL